MAVLEHCRVQRGWMLLLLRFSLQFTDPEITNVSDLYTVVNENGADRRGIEEA